MISHAGILKKKKKISAVLSKMPRGLSLMFYKGNLYSEEVRPGPFADRSLVLPDFQLNANVQMISLPVTPSACGGSSFIDYNELHV